MFLVTIASPTLAQDEAKSNRFTLELRTKLGVARRIRVHITRTGDGLLDALGAYWGQGVPDYNWERFPDARLAIQTGDDTFALVPWTSLKEITEKNKKQVVTLKDSTSYEGVIKTIAFVEDDKDQDLRYSDRKKYNLSTATSLAVVQIPPRGKSRTKKPRSNKRWTLSSVAHEPRTRVKSPRFVFQYYTSAGYILGGTDTESVTSAFILNVDGWRVSERFDPTNTLAILLEAGSRVDPVHSPPTLLADSGVENRTRAIDELVESGAIRRVLAQVEIAASRSFLGDERLQRAPRHQCRTARGGQRVGRRARRFGQRVDGSSSNGYLCRASIEIPECERRDSGPLTPSRAPLAAGFNRRQHATGEKCYSNHARTPHLENDS